MTRDDDFNRTRDTEHSTKYRKYFAARSMEFAIDECNINRQQFLKITQKRVA